MDLLDGTFMKENSCFKSDETTLGGECRVFWIRRVKTGGANPVILGNMKEYHAHIHINTWALLKICMHKHTLHVDSLTT